MSFSRPLVYIDAMTPEGFEELVRPFRRELAAHCYRMLGSLTEAEDHVQETLLHAWRGIDGFEGRSSVRSWLYKIATNSCVDALRRRPRRLMPFELGEPHDPAKPFPPPSEEMLWIEPAPAWLIDESTPEALYSSRESVQLAFIVALQHLPPAQRAAIILRDVLGWSASETAELLETTVPAVNSALQRARETLEIRRKKPGKIDPATRGAIVERYMRAWEAADIDALASVLHEDVVSSMPPNEGWFRGREDLAAFFRRIHTGPDVYRVREVDAPDDAVLAFYRADATSGEWRPHAMAVLSFAESSIDEVHVFLAPSVLQRFGLPKIDR